MVVHRAGVPGSNLKVRDMPKIGDSWGATKVGREKLEKARMKVTKREAQWFFRKYDMDRSGTLQREEVREMLDSIKQIPDPAFAANTDDINMKSVRKVTDRELDALIRVACGLHDTAAGGSSSNGVPAAACIQLLVMHRALSRHRHVINRAFDKWDVDKNDELDAKELTAFMSHLDPRATQREIETVVESLFQMDKNSDRKVSREEMLASVGYWKEVVSSAKAQSRRRALSSGCCGGGGGRVAPEDPLSAGVHSGSSIFVLPATADDEAPAPA